MNLYTVVDPDNGNFLNAHYKWADKIYKARLFTTIANANKARAELRKKSPKKYIVQEYELIHRKDR